MKMVRSLLLGSAAGFVAVAGAQAADMPVKAKPVEYVKICTLYGAGFYYLPGTDICVKHGAYVRSQTYWNMGNAPGGGGPFFGVGNGQQVQFLNSPNDLVMRVRAVYTQDMRTQTEYGTLRAYTLIGFTSDGPANQIGTTAPTLYATRGFIQFAGFTLGKASSFYDIFSVPGVSYFGVISSDTGDAGEVVISYTFQFGNGFSATIGAEDPRRHAVVNTSSAFFVAQGAVAQPPGAPGGVFTTAALTGLNAVVFTNPFTVGGAPTPDQGNVRWPDFVANLRVDQAWGSLQVMGAVHDNSGGFFTTAGGGAIGATGFPTCTPFTGSLSGQMSCGHPSDEVGFAVGAGGIIKVPMPTGLTDVLSFQFNWTEGASRYAAFTQPGAGSPAMFGGTGLAQCPALANNVPGGAVGAPCVGSLGLGFWTDGIYANPGLLPGYNGSVHNTTVWGVNGGWDHLWTPNLKTSLYGAFIRVEYDATARQLINLATCFPGVGGAAPTATVAGAQPGRNANTLTNMTNCNPDFSFWQLGSRTQWNITPSFYVGVDAMYQKLETAFAGNAIFQVAANLPRPSGNYQIKDQDIVSVTARAHWDILP